MCCNANRTSKEKNNLIGFILQISWYSISILKSLVQANEIISEEANNSTKSYWSFFYTRGDKNMPVAIKLFKAKPISQMLYSCQVYTYSKLKLKILRYHSVQILISALLSILLNQECAGVHLEIRMIPLETRSYIDWLYF